MIHWPSWHLSTGRNMSETSLPWSYGESFICIRVPSSVAQNRIAICLQHICLAVNENLSQHTLVWIKTDCSSLSFLLFAEGKGRLRKKKVYFSYSHMYLLFTSLGLLSLFRVKPLSISLLIHVFFFLFITAFSVDYFLFYCFLFFLFFNFSFTFFWWPLFSFHLCC